jgi:hypothetical protein
MLRTGLAVTVCAAVAAVGASSVGAVPDGAVGRCPDGVGDPRPVADIYLFGSSFYGLQSADINGDGYTCIRMLENSPTKIVFSDNVLPL